MTERKKYSGFEMTGESNQAIALVLVLLGFSLALIASKNGEQLLYQLDTSSIDWCWLTSKPSRLVEPSVVLLCRFWSPHLVFKVTDEIAFTSHRFIKIVNYSVNSIGSTLTENGG